MASTGISLTPVMPGCGPEGLSGEAHGLRMGGVRLERLSGSGRMSSSLVPDAKPLAGTKQGLREFSGNTRVCAMCLHVQLILHAPSLPSEMQEQRANEPREAVGGGCRG